MTSFYLKISNLFKSPDQISFWSNFGALLNGLITSLILAIYYHQLPSKLPLFFSLAWGENQLVDLSQFFILPFAIFLVVFVNLIIARHLHQSQSIVKRTLAISSAIISILILITTFKIIYIFV